MAYSYVSKIKTLCMVDPWILLLNYYYYYHFVISLIPDAEVLVVVQDVITIFSSLQVCVWFVILESPVGLCAEYLCFFFGIKCLFIDHLGLCEL